MAHLLHIDSSPRGDRSHSRKLSKEFVEAWKQTYPSDTVTYPSSVTFRVQEAINKIVYPER